MSSLSIGIVGLPNVGKSTLFNALTKSQVLAANYPFATIEPNVGIVAVPDERLEVLARLSNSARTVPATITFTDIAGLVRGAAGGAGLGNKFLSHVRECQALAQVVRNFSDTNVAHVDGQAEPSRDIATIATELALADLETVQNRLNRLTKEAKTDNSSHKEMQILQKVAEILDRGELLHQHFPDEIPQSLQQLQLLSIKPMIYVFNLDEDELSDVELQKKLSALVAPAHSIFLSAQVESQLQDMDDAEKQELLASLGQSSSGLSVLAELGYKSLGLQSYFTSGVKESRAWTIRKGATAPAAAGVIHTDFERGFIKADVVSYEDFVSSQGWNGARASGKVRLEGRDYVMAEGDVVEFKFNT